MAGRARGGRIGPHEQVRRGLSGSSLLRRLRGRRRDRAARDRPREGAVRRRARERPAARRRSGEHGRLLRAPRAGRHRALAAARPRRAPDPRAEGQLLGPALHDRPLRRLARDRRRRRGRDPRARARAPAEDRHLRRLRVSAHRRHGDVPPGRRRGRRVALVRHGAFRRTRRRRAASEPGRALRRRHVDHAQDARGPARRARPLPRGACDGDRSRRLPGDAGRPARARDRREGDVLPDRDDRRLPRLPAADSQRTPTRSPRRCSRAGSTCSRAGPTPTCSSSTCAPRSGRGRTPRSGSTRPG